MNNRTTTTTIFLLCFVIGVLGCIENGKSKRSNRSKVPPTITLLESAPVPEPAQGKVPESDASTPPEALPTPQESPETLAEKLMRLKARLDEVERRATQPMLEEVVR